MRASISMTLRITLMNRFQQSSLSHFIARGRAVPICSKTFLEIGRSPSRRIRKINVIKRLTRSANKPNQPRCSVSKDTATNPLHASSRRPSGSVVLHQLSNSKSHQHPQMLGVVGLVVITNLISNLEYHVHPRLNTVAELLPRGSPPDLVDC